MASARPEGFLFNDLNIDDISMGAVSGEGRICGVAMPVRALFCTWILLGRILTYSRQIVDTAKISIYLKRVRDFDSAAFHAGF